MRDSGTFSSANMPIYQSSSVWEVWVSEWGTCDTIYPWVGIRLQSRTRNWNWTNQSLSYKLSRRHFFNQSLSNNFQGGQHLFQMWWNAFSEIPRHFARTISTPCHKMVLATPSLQTMVSHLAYFIPSKHLDFSIDFYKYAVYDM